MRVLEQGAIVSLLLQVLFAYLCEDTFKCCRRISFVSTERGRTNSSVTFRVSIRCGHFLRFLRRFHAVCFPPWLQVWTRLIPFHGKSGQNRQKDSDNWNEGHITGENNGC